MNRVHAGASRRGPLIMSLMKVIWCFVPLAVSFFLVVLLEEKINAWFAPFSGASPGTPQASASASPGPANPLAQPLRPRRTRFSIVLDPGHGGRGERRSATTGDGWDPVLGEFTFPYMNGGSRTVDGVTYTEQEVVLSLARRVKAILDRTADDRTWPEFEKLVRRYQDLSKSPVPRIRLDVVLTRDNSYLDHPDAASPNVNRYFRLFDSPESFPAGPATPLHAGRLSFINQLGADLVVAIHANDSGAVGLRGSTALFVPPYEFWDSMRQMATGAKPWGDLRSNPYYVHQIFTKHNRREELAEDATRYFADGAASNVTGGRKVGLSYHDRIRWRYRENPPVARTDLKARFDGPYWERERSRHEAFRRAGGQEDFGGDNLYASQELIRFYRYALWRDFVASGSVLPWPAPADRGAGRPHGAPASGPEVYLGRHAPPLCGDWLVSHFTNSVVAYLEVAYLSNAQDLWLWNNKLDVMAEGIAVGIYSLTAGVHVKEMPALPPPRGARIDWERYGDLPGGRTWFEMARPGTNP